MRVLLDTCVWGGAKGGVASGGHDVVWAGDWPEDPGDEEILARAHAEGRVLVTLDKDFGELAVVRHRRPHGAWKPEDGLTSLLCRNMIARNTSAV